MTIRGDGWHRKGARHPDDPVLSSPRYRYLEGHEEQARDVS
jgi:hypothetical protein